MIEEKLNRLEKQSDRKHVDPNSVSKLESVSVVSEHDDPILRDTLNRASPLKLYVSKLVSDFVKNLFQEVSAEITEQSEASARDIRRDLEQLESELGGMGLPCVLDLLQGRPSYTAKIKECFEKVQEKVFVNG